jgi:hypothetical protein
MKLVTRGSLSRSARASPRRTSPSQVEASLVDVPSGTQVDVPSRPVIASSTWVAEPRGSGCPDRRCSASQAEQRSVIDSRPQNQHDFIAHHRARDATGKCWDARVGSRDAHATQDRALRDPDLQRCKRSYVVPPFTVLSHEVLPGGDLLPNLVRNRPRLGHPVLGCERQLCAASITPARIAGSDTASTRTHARTRTRQARTVGSATPKMVHIRRPLPRLGRSNPPLRWAGHDRAVGLVENLVQHTSVHTRSRKLSRLQVCLGPARTRSCTRWDSARDPGATRSDESGASLRPLRRRETTPS